MKNPHASFIIIKPIRAKVTEEDRPTGTCNLQFLRQLHKFYIICHNWSKEEIEMRLIITMALLVLSIMMPCIAEPDSVTTGPYNVSFDLGIPKDAYKVEVAEPELEESLSGDIHTTYGIELTNKTGLSRTAILTMLSYETERIIPLPDELTGLVVDRLLQMGNIYNIDVAERKIGGQVGAVASGEVGYPGTNLYFAIYYLSSTDVVTIASAYPWEEGTLQLLKTIHVEKINETA